MGWRRRHPGWIVVWTGPAAVAVALITSSRCGGRETHPGAPAGPHVLLITVDTLRADRLGCYGSTTVRTPHIDRLASEGTLFEASASPMQMTRPSHFSLFTSVYPRDHGVVNNTIPLAVEFPTLSEVFRDAGYETSGIVAVRLLDRRSGADRGFEHFEAPEGQVEIGAEEVVRRAMDRLAARDPSRPFFLWLHLFDPHTPYAPPEPFVPACSELMRQEMPVADWESISRLAGEHGGELPREAYDRALALYGGEVENTDHWIGVLLDHLRSSGLLDRTIVVFTADHGECFDHGIYFEHAGCLYDGAVLIPLIFRYPGAVPPAARRSEIVEILDVAPTVLELAGLKSPAEFQGRALFDPTDPPREAAFIQHPVYTERQVRARSNKLAGLRSVSGLPPVRLPLADGEQVGLRTREWKYILTGDKEELYRVPSPESADESSARPDVLARLRPLLNGWRSAHPLRIQPPGKTNEDVQQTLRSLGYVQ